MFDYIDRWERSLKTDPISLNNNEPINFNFEVVESPLLDKKIKIHRNVVDMTLRLDPKEFIPLLNDMWDEMNSPVKLLMSKNSWIFLFIKLHPSFLADHWLVPIRVDSFYRDDVYNITQVEFIRLVMLFNQALCTFDWETRFQQHMFLPHLLYVISKMGTQYLSRVFTKNKHFINS